MKRFRRLSSLCLAAAAIAVCGSAVPVAAQSVAPLPAPTIINSAPYTITAAGYYQLGANLSYAGTGTANDAIITINASNVTLDFGGHYITGSSNTATKLYGVYANERANVLIQNGTVSSCYTGVYMTGNNTATTNHRNSRVLNMTLTKCYYVGTEIDNAINAEVTDCRVSSIGGTTAGNGFAVGVYLYNCTGAKAMNNSISNVALSSSAGNGYGVAVGSYAVGNLVTNCAYGIFDVDKYKDNLTDGCATPFDGGTAVGDNN